MLSEYTWYLRDEDVERHVGLMKSDFDRVRQSGDPFVALSHYYAMTGEWRAGLRAYDRLLDYATGKADLRFCTVGDLVKRAQDGGKV